MPSLHVRNEANDGWILISDGTAGSPGAQGPQGIQGIQGIQGPAGVDGTSGSGGHVIQEAGVDMATRLHLNFTGSGVDVQDDAGNNATVVTITAGSGGGGGQSLFKGAKVYRTSNLTVSATGWQDISWADALGEVEYDIGDFYDEAVDDYYFQPPDSGYYNFHLQLFCQGPLPTASYIQAGLWKNNFDALLAQEIVGWFGSSSGSCVLQLSMDAYCLSTDNFRVRVECGAGDTVNSIFSSGAGKTFFEVHKLEKLENYILEGAAVYRSSGQTITTETPTIVTWTNERYDTSSIFDSGSSGKLICREAGYYHAVAQIGWGQNNVGVRRIRLLKNNTEVALDHDTPLPSNVRTMHLVTDLSLLVGDYLEVEAWHNKGSDSDVDGNADGSYTFFSISRIGT